MFSNVRLDLFEYKKCLTSVFLLNCVPVSHCPAGRPDRMGGRWRTHLYSVFLTLRRTVAIWIWIMAIAITICHQKQPQSKNVSILMRCIALAERAICSAHRCSSSRRQKTALAGRACVFFFLFRFSLHGHRREYLYRACVRAQWLCNVHSGRPEKSLDNNRTIQWNGKREAIGEKMNEGPHPSPTHLSSLRRIFLFLFSFSIYRIKFPAILDAQTISGFMAHCAYRIMGFLYVTVGRFSKRMNHIGFLLWPTALCARHMNALSNSWPDAREIKKKY